MRPFWSLQTTQPGFGRLDIIIHELMTARSPVNRHLSAALLQQIDEAQCLLLRHDRVTYTGD